MREISKFEYLRQCIEFATDLAEHGSDAMCMIWPFAKSAYGYGNLRFGKKYYQTHRLACELATNCKLQSNQLVMHICDNPPCFNPAHLRIGTAKENSIDAWLKGRHPGMPRMQGSKHPRAKLTEADVIRMRSLHATGEYTNKELGAIFNVSYRHVQEITTNQFWKHCLNVHD